MTSTAADTLIKWEYDKDGKVVEMTKEDGTILAYTYGDGARLTQIDVSNAPGIVIGTTQQTFDYSDLGRAEATDNNDPALGSDNVTAAWLHDSLGRTIEESQKIAVGCVRRHVSYNYASTRRESTIYPNARKVEYTYHDSGALNTIEDDGSPDVVIAEYEYLGGRVLQRNMQNGVDLDLTNGSGTYFDHLGRPTQYLHKDTGGTVIGFEYAYDSAGNKLMQKSVHDATDSQRYSYDSANRLTAYVRGTFADFCDPVTANPPSGETQARRWTLDGLGNWDQLVTKVSGSSTTEDREDTTFNEYSTIDPDGPGGSDPIAQSHDDNGNLTGDGDQSYKWDAFNRLREVYDDTPALIATYTYDAGNRRMRKDLATGTDVDYHYSGWQVLEEYEGGANPKRQFVYGNYIDEVLVMDVNDDNDSSCIETNDDTRYFYHQNTIYSVYGLSNASGTVVEKYNYDPYGKRIVKLNGSTGNPYAYTGQRLDPETGLIYYKNRYYDYDRGRFISRDPIGVDGGINLYGYVQSNPVIKFDPVGLSFIDSWVNWGKGLWLDPELVNAVNHLPDDPSEKGRWPKGTLHSTEYGDMVWQWKWYYGDARIRSATGSTNSAFAVDGYGQYESDIDKVQKLIIDKLCPKAVESGCCSQSKCKSEAIIIAGRYIRAVRDMRRDWVAKFGWIGKGWMGNGANWINEGQNTRLQRKIRYYFKHRAPGPLCWEWQKQVRKYISGSSYECFRINGLANRALPMEHNWVNLMVKTAPADEYDGQDRGNDRIILDPWPTATPKAKYKETISVEYSPY